LPARCIALAEGYPLGFMPGYQGVHEIDRLALMKDWAQWPLVATSALYAFELLRRARIVPIRHWRAQVAVLPRPPNENRSSSAGA